MKHRTPAGKRRVGFDPPQNNTQCAGLHAAGYHGGLAVQLSIHRASQGGLDPVAAIWAEQHIASMQVLIHNSFRVHMCHSSSQTLHAHNYLPH